MPKTILQQFTATPDTGSLKNTLAQYDFLQNIQGRTGLGRKRNGVQWRADLDSGCMGIFDLYNDGDPTSLDRVAVITGDGDMEIFRLSELLSMFTYAIDTGGAFYQQSADNSWWQIAPDSTTGLLSVTGVAAPSSTRSTDLVVEQGHLFGFEDASGIWRMYVNNEYPPSIAPATERHATTSIVTTYTSIAFTKSVGVVFELDTLDRYRLGVDNAGALTITGV